MRRGLASLILGLSLVVASVAWSGFVLLHTVLDPSRSERLADEMLDNTVLRGALVDAIADSLEAGLPGDVTVPRSDVEAAAGRALDDPRVDAVVRDGLVRVHRNVLEGVEEPVVIDPSAFGAAARDALVGVHPQLDGVLPAVPPAAIRLPDTGLGFLGDIRDLLDRTVDTASLIALGGVLLALVITTDRPSVLRRVGVWALAAAAFWLILGYGLPWLAEQVLPQSAAVFAAGVQVFLGSMILPALLLAAGGGVLLLLALLWSSVGVAGRGVSRARGRRSRAEASSYGGPAPSAPIGGWYGNAPDGRQAAAAPSDATRVQAPGGGWGAPAGGAPSPWDETRVHRTVPRSPGPSGGDRTVVQRGPGGSVAPDPGGGWPGVAKPDPGGPWWEPPLDPWAAPPAPNGEPATGPHPPGSDPASQRHERSGEVDGTADRTGRADPERGEPAARRAPRWVEGVGYVDD